MTYVSPSKFTRSLLSSKNVSLVSNQTEPSRSVVTAWLRRNVISARQTESVRTETTALDLDALFVFRIQL